MKLFGALRELVMMVLTLVMVVAAAWQEVHGNISGATLSMAWAILMTLGTIRWSKP